MKSKKIFISHSSLDKPFARKLATSLMEFGYDPWLDELKIKVGDDILSKVEDGIKQSDYLIVILSSNSVTSSWVEKEWKIKFWDEIENKRLFVLPVLISNCKIPELLKNKKYADFRVNYIYGFNSLIDAIEGHNRNKLKHFPKEIYSAISLDSDITTYEIITQELAKNGNITQSLLLAENLQKHYELKNDFLKSAIWALHIAVQLRHQAKFPEALNKYSLSEQLILKVIKKRKVSFDAYFNLIKIRAGRIMVEDYILNSNFSRAYTQYSILLKEIANYKRRDLFSFKKNYDTIFLYKTHLIRQQAEMQRLVGNYSKSLSLFVRAFNEYHSIYVEEKAFAILGQAECYRMLGDYHRANKLYSDVEWIARQKGFKRLLARILRSKVELYRVYNKSNIANIMSELKSLSDSDEIRYQFGLIYYHLINGGYFLESNLDLAFQHFNEAKEIVQKNSFALKLEYAYTLLGIAETQRLKNNKQIAADFYQDALKCFRESKMKWGILRCQIGLKIISKKFSFHPINKIEGVDQQLLKYFSRQNYKYTKSLYLNIP